MQVVCTLHARMAQEMLLVQTSPPEKIKSSPTDEELLSSRGPAPGEKKRQLKNAYRAILAEVGKEIERSHDLGFGLFNSAHEGYAIMLEEFDELKAHVWMKQKNRDIDKMRKEAIEVAAMSVKFVESIDAGAGRK